MYVDWDGATPVGGLRVSMPAQWKVVGVRTYSPSTGIQPASVEQIPGGVLAESSVEGPCRFLIEFVAGPNPGNGMVNVVPLAREGEAVSRRASTVRPSPAQDETPNHVASFDGGASVMIRRDQVPSLSLTRSHKVSLWLRTTTTDEVVLSDWTGNESDAYDLEIMVSANGSLAAYRGRPGHHESMISAGPVADGRWHHVVVSYDARTRWSRLHIDGAPVDSIITSLPPSNPRSSPIILGGRADRAMPMASFSGMLDDLVLNGGGDVPEFEVDFETPPIASQGVRLFAANVRHREAMHEIEASINGGSVELSWDSQDRATTMYVVERSYDGSEFVEIGRVSPADHVAGRYTFVDRSAVGEVVYYRVNQRLESGGARSSAAIKTTIKIGLADLMATADPGASPLKVWNFPNPFRESTSVHYELDEGGHVELSVWDLSGQPLATLVDAQHSPGSYEVSFVPASSLPAGTYFVRLRVGDQIASHKLLHIK